MKINKVSKEKLEFSKVLRVFAREARSNIGALFIKELNPLDSMDSLAKRHELIEAFMLYLSRHGDIPWSDGLQPVNEILEAAKSTSFLNGEELYQIQRMIRLAMKLKEHFLEERDSQPVFLQITRKIRDFSKEVEALNVIDEHGRIEDSASPRLRDIRNALVENRAQARRTISRLIHDPQISGYLQEKTIGIKNGRLVFSVRHEYINRFPGVVLDRSSSGHTIFMEHEKLIPVNNRISVLISEEKEESERILRDLTQLMLKREKALLDSQAAIGLSDYLYAISAIISKSGWILPETSKKPFFDLKGVIHPLLSGNAVPLNIACGKSFKVLVITGPNTGGKTVALKTVGLAVAMTWYGLPIPALEGSVIGDFSGIWLDIGDEQSIEQNLSTFSAHLQNIISILKHSDEKSLLLLDELGSGTDPQEGAALGIAILDTLHEKGILTLATTHHNPIKRYALGTRGVETASMEFDHKTMSPTYKLLMGIPGKSNAILIAGRQGMPETVLEKARAVRLGAEHSVEELISELHEKQRILDVTKEELIQERKILMRLKKDYEQNLGKAEYISEKLISQAEKKAEDILDKAQQTARNLIRRIEGAAESAAQREMHNQKMEMNEQIRSFSERKKKREKNVEPQTLKPELKEGQSVEIVGSGFKGVLASLSEKKGTVISGPLRMEVPLGQIRILNDKISKSGGDVKITISRPSNVPGSVMVRGMTVDEAIPVVSRYLDQAMRAGYGSVTVIHGRGEGILRREVHKLCRSLEYVEDFCLGGPSEGGYGVTIVRFRK